MSFLEIVALVAVISFGPRGPLDGLTGELMEGLPNELGASAAHDHQRGVAAAFVNGSDAAELLHGRSAGPRFTAGSKYIAISRGTVAAPAPGKESKIGLSG